MPARSGKHIAPRRTPRPASDGPEGQSNRPCLGQKIQQRSTAVHFGFFTDQDATRYCYLRLRRLKKALKDPTILGALVHELQVPSDGQHPSSARTKMAAIELHVDHLRGDKTSVWYGVPAAEVLSAAIFSARKSSDGAAGGLFNEVARKEDLAEAITLWLGISGFNVYKDLPAEMPGAEVFGYQIDRFMTKPRILGIELHNDLSQLEPTLDRMATLAEYTHAMYLACTPALAAEFLVARVNEPNVEHWEPLAFRKKLASRGFGLLLVEGDAVSESLAPKEQKPDLAKALEFIAAHKKKDPART